MKLNPHGDAAIYDTMVRLSRGYGALLHPLVDSKGNFGKVYSRDMAWAASRYILKRIQESDALEKKIADLEDTVNSPKRVQKIIMKELTDVNRTSCV